jgi:hypothetical protein
MKYRLKQYRNEIICISALCVGPITLFLSTDVGPMFPIVFIVTAGSATLLFLNWFSKKISLVWLNQAMEQIKKGKQKQCLQLLIQSTRFYANIQDDVFEIYETPALMTPQKVLEVINKALGTEITPEQVEINT